MKSVKFGCEVDLCIKNCPDFKNISRNLIYKGTVELRGPESPVATSIMYIGVHCVYWYPAPWPEEQWKSVPFCPLPVLSPFSQRPCNSHSDNFPLFEITPPRSTVICWGSNVMSSGLLSFLTPHFQLGHLAISPGTPQIPSSSSSWLCFHLMFQHLSLKLWQRHT